MSAHDPKRTSTEALQTPTLFLPGDAFGAYRRRKVAIAAARIFVKWRLGQTAIQFISGCRPIDGQSHQTGLGELSILPAGHGGRASSPCRLSLVTRVH